MDWELVGGSVCFVLSNFVNVDDPFLSVDLDNFSLASLAGSSQDCDFVVFADGERSDSVLFPEIFGESGRHDSLSDV